MRFHIFPIPTHFPIIRILKRSYFVNIRLFLLIIFSIDAIILSTFLVIVYIDFRNVSQIYFFYICLAPYGHFCYTEKKRRLIP